VAANDHAGGPVELESAHRLEPGLKPTVVGFDPIVGVLSGVVAGSRHQFADHFGQRLGLVGSDLARFSVSGDRSGEEPRGCRGVALPRHEDVDDLPVLVDSSVDIAPAAGYFHIRLVHEPPVPNRVATRPGRVDEQWGKSLHPPIQGDVVDLNPALSE